MIMIILFFWTIVVLSAETIFAHQADTNLSRIIIGQWIKQFDKIWLIRFILPSWVFNNKFNILIVNSFFLFSVIRTTFVRRKNESIHVLIQ